MSFQVGRPEGRTTGPGLWGQNEKTPQPDVLLPKGVRRRCRRWGNRRWLPVWIYLQEPRQQLKSRCGQSRAGSLPQGTYVGHMFVV
jgi:hypothetical protein